MENILLYLVMLPLCADNNKLCLVCI